MAEGRIGGTALPSDPSSVLVKIMNIIMIMILRRSRIRIVLMIKIEIMIMIMFKLMVMIMIMMLMITSPHPHPLPTLSGARGGWGEKRVGADGGGSNSSSPFRFLLSFRPLPSATWRRVVDGRGRMGGDSSSFRPFLPSGCDYDYDYDYDYDCAYD